jgi:hypothetical protein
MKITNTTIGKFGRLGNQLWQVSSLLGLSDKHNAKPCIPTSWSYRSDFNIPEAFYEDVDAKLTFSEGYYHYNPKVIPDGDYDAVCLKGYFQSEKYFEDIKDKIKEWLKPAPYPVADNAVGVHVRRGDYVGNPAYTQLNADYYLAVIDKYFNDPKYVFYITTDDVEYAKKNFIGDRYVIEERSAINDLRVLSSCEHHILAPSSFSWWGAYLAKPGGINIRPKRTHVGHLSHLKEDDMWVKDWTVEDVTPLRSAPPCYGSAVKKIDLSDFTFVIPVKYDHSDRKENLFVVIPYLQKWFNTNIILGEQGPKSEFAYFASLGVKYIQFPEGDFHRTRFINEMTVMAETPYVFNWDADVIVSVEGIVEAAKLLREGNPFVYPYSGDFLHVPRLYIPTIMGALNTNVFNGKEFKGVGDNSVGGAVGFNREMYFFEDENFYSHAPEDWARAYLSNLVFGGYKRVNYPLYHLDHYCGKDSRHSGHDCVVLNNTERRRVLSVKTKAEAIRFIESWPWFKEYRAKLGLPPKLIL